MFEILEKESVSDSITRYIVRAPYVARNCAAGNFVIIRVNENGERIPLTVVEADRERGTITLVVQSVGKTTRLLANLRAGDSIRDVVGPLGKPTSIIREGTVICVGGGVGTAEIFPIVRALKAAGNRVLTIVGARTRSLLILLKELEQVADRLEIVTDDGSTGEKGVVTDVLGRLLREESCVDAVYAVGPMPMMKAVSNLTRPLNLKTIVSLNSIMVDGTGMCGGCRVSVGGKMQFACVDGPEFDGHEVDFDELMFRSQSYKEFERLADDTFRGNGAAKHEQVTAWRA
ncbi:MAG TPA: sulfide/dihydroorotate dehydrogenase-like FAD/NAD-binding protein [Bacteroidota bacterium]|nr:sulfide/dihydroorotate dehydrogenase-like FAD/NAD-binding protein [Bacteroidota bacterium]